ncbi:fumarate hydratase [Myxococcota bacterium]|nr:fumarate hydratase [Myxococcota bacterium]MBU1432564.1 fumarate hydratase [Myxococcota bacterium]MBU1899571.1 fumarate hydratase [Myxococcota bacterium]
MSAFQYQKPFPLGPDETEYRLLTQEHVSTQPFGEGRLLVVAPEALTHLAREAMREVSFYLRPAHQARVAEILTDPEASENDRFVARTMLENSVIAAEGMLPTCQDTGTAIIMGRKGQNVFTGGGDAEALSLGVFEAYRDHHLRYSQVVPLTMYEEKNTGTNLPAQIDLYAYDGDEYHFTFVAKGGGSANKTYLFQQTKALLNPDSLESFLIEKMRTLGTAACPPYHLAFVIGGTSAEATLKAVKLASIGDLDGLPTTGNEGGRAFRDLDLEAKLLAAAQTCGIGAQFGGKAFAHDVRVIRLPRHGASCPVGMGVSCSADRNVRAKINHEGLWLEVLEKNPARFLVGVEAAREATAVEINLDQPMKDILAALTPHPVKTRVSLTGTMIVARDIAHARFKAILDAGQPLPDYLLKHPVYYAGPAKKPEGLPSGSFGPTTANRMDPYVDLLQARGGSMVMIAKGNRSEQVTRACKKHGGFYLGSIGGPAAKLAKESIKHVEVLDFPELGMEAVWKIEVVGFPAFILVDDKGNDFFEGL